MEKDLKFTFNPGAVDQNRGLIYRWEIKDANGEVKGLYIGKAKAGGERPLKHYKRNVKRLLAGKPYRLGNPDGFRKSHRALAQAAVDNYSVELSFVCNIAEGCSIDTVEQNLILQHNCCGTEAWQLNQ
jgi:hypothetical protein